MPATTLGKSLFWIGQGLEVIGIAWAIWGLQQEWRLFSEAVASFVTRFKKPPDQVLAQPETLKRGLTSKMGMIDSLDVWPSDPHQQIAGLKSRIEEVRTQIDGQFADAAKNVAESEARMNSRVDDVGKKLSDVADDLSKFKRSNWVPRLGGPFVAGAGVVLTVAGNCIG